jgi:polyisoprenoid-binding protein YceI
MVAVAILMCSWAALALAAASQLPARFRIDPHASRVWFDADARLHTFRGETRRLSGGFTLAQSAPPRLAEAKVIIDAASLETGNAERDADMRRDFLHVAAYPTIEFSVLDIPVARPGMPENTWDVILQGRLTVHGVTREVRVPATVRLAADGIAARGQVYLDMRDFNIRVPRLFLIPMKSEVLVGFEVLARPES